MTRLSRGEYTKVVGQSPHEKIPPDRLEVGPPSYTYIYILIRVSDFQIAHVNVTFCALMCVFNS